MADPNLSPKRLGDIPAGFKRNEENTKRTDQLAERAETEGAPFEGINEQKFRETDNEIIGSIKRDARSGILYKDISNKQQGYIYTWLKNPATCKTIEGEMACDAMQQGFEAIGGEIVQGDMPEGKELRGQGKENLGSYRGWGDVRLWRIKREFYEANERAQKAREQRRGLIEQETVNRMMANGFTGSADPNHPAFKRSGVTDPSHAETFKVNFTEADLRRGSMKDAQGNTVEPGYDRR